MFRETALLNAVMQSKYATEVVHMRPMYKCKGYLHVWQSRVENRILVHSAECEWPTTERLMEFNKVLDEGVVVVFARPRTRTAPGGIDCCFRVGLAEDLQVVDGYQ